MTSPNILVALAALVGCCLLCWWLYTFLQAKSAAETLRLRQASQRARRAVEVVLPPPQRTAKAHFGRR